MEVSPQFSSVEIREMVDHLRGEILASLREQGFSLDKELRLQERTYTKEEIRGVHSHFRSEALLRERTFIKEWFPRLFPRYFASGGEVTPDKVKPIPVLVSDNADELASLFRLASLWWSVPVSRGFGRRFRVVVLDESNGKLIGLLGLTDPVFNLRARDSWIGWDVRAREKRLRHIMDAYVLGAVPPYNRLLGAKLMALIAASDFLRDAFRRRYAGTRSIIKRRRFDGRLAMVTATSALGRSSIYNRLRFNGEDAFTRVGETEGYGHFHLANGTFKQLHAFLQAIGNSEIDRYDFGQGPNFRIRVVRVALERLGLPSALLRHGIRREVYVAPLAKNSVAFLKGEAKRLRWRSRPLEAVIAHWRDRWLLPRANRDPSYKEFDRNTWYETLNFSRPSG